MVQSECDFELPGKRYRYHRRGLSHTGLAQTPTKPNSDFDDEEWQEPAPYDGVRKIQMASTCSARGSSVFNGRVLHHESELEYRLAVIMQARSDVVEIRSQFPRVAFGSSGKNSHTFDYWVRFSCGRRVAVAVKYEKHRAKLEGELRQVLAAGSTEFDRIAVMTEHDITVEKYQNALSILRTRELHDESQVNLLKSELANKGSKVCFLELYNPKVPLGPRSTAVWRLIDAGVLKPLQPGLITDVTWFSVNL